MTTALTVVIAKGIGCGLFGPEIGPGGDAGKGGGGNITEGANVLADLYRVLNGGLESLSQGPGNQLDGAEEGGERLQASPRVPALSLSSSPAKNQPRRVGSYLCPFPSDPICEAGPLSL
jgi:hypothetical protein